jgi:beta-1,2-mannobiose phosphorylase / 1,2-beta-oligomannan phosphorylase
MPAIKRRLSEWFTCDSRTNVGVGITNERGAIMNSHPIRVERCNNGIPIVSPGTNWWETGVTFNAAAVYLERSAVNDVIIHALLPQRRLDDADLSHGVVAIHYRARPETDPGYPFVRSFIGLAVFTPDFKLLDRFQEPVVFPAAASDGYDYLGVEDPRITRIGDMFYMVYCGLEYDPETIYHARLCSARSKDLVQWEKLGPLKGDVNAHYNKDGVLFPAAVRGKFVLLHRPWTKSMTHADYSMHLATSAAPDGIWHDEGEILHSFKNPDFDGSWIGAGSVPISIGDGKYVMIYHTGNSCLDGKLEYDLDLAMFDMNRLEHAASSIVTARIEHFMVPETPEELASNSSLQVQNVLFTCGSFEYGEHIYIVYGGADTYLLVARMKKMEVLSALAKADLRNPFVS